MSKSRRLWSPEEDNILRTLVQEYGRNILTHRVIESFMRNWRLTEISLISTENDKVDWRVIASYLPGRNNKDCRKRWHYQVAASMNLGTWSPAEAELLKAGIHRYGKQ